MRRIPWDRPVRVAGAVAVLILLIQALAVAPGIVRAAEPTFGTPTAIAMHGVGVTFGQPVDATETITRAEVLVTLPGSPGPFVSEVDPPPCCDPAKLEYVISDADGHIVPNTHFTARWRLTTKSGVVVGPPASATYEDTQFEWKTRVGKVVRVHWYGDRDAYAAQALKTGERAVDEAAKLLGVTETEPIDIFVYDGPKTFYEAVGPGTRENVGATAHPDIRTVFARADQPIDATMTHEITHLVFDTATKNAYHYPPRWLNEGLAVYVSEGYPDYYRSIVADATAAGSVIPLDGLAGLFPTVKSGFYLAYGESVSAVDYLVRTFGKPALVKLVRSYADGVSDDEAFRAALGVDVAGFQAAWFDDLGAATSSAIGPRPAPGGPLPAGWSGSPDAPGAPVSSSIPGAVPAAPAGVARPSAAPSPDGAGSGTDEGARGLLLAFVGLAVVAAVGGLLVLRRRGARPG